MQGGSEMSRDTVRDRAIYALTKAFDHAVGVARDEAGYVDRIEDNLSTVINWQHVRPFFAQGAGGEIDDRDDEKAKMRAIHSSSALAVNAFGHWLGREGELTLCGQSGFKSLSFEAKCPTGLQGTPPHLDVLAEADEWVVGVESKCLEPLTDHKAVFAASYDSLRETLGDDPWFALMEQLRSNPTSYRRLDVAQLAKHSFGLSHSYPAKRKSLLYVYWEPSNWQELAEYRTHREEIARLKAVVAGAHVRFHSKSYPELWREWESSIEECQWLRDRYVVSI